MKIMPCVSSGIVFLREDGTIEMPAFQVMRIRGVTVIRIGRNTLWFTEDGKFDGTECSTDGLGIHPEISALQAAFEQSARNDGQRPATAYFQPDSNGYDVEVAWWPPSVKAKETH
jgi:hypothetical protein